MTTPNSLEAGAACPFSIYYAGDAYSTSTKIMGRQSAGKAFMKGVARTWARGDLYGTGPDIAAGKAMFNQLQKDGYAGQLKWSTLPDFQVSTSVGSLYYPAPPSKAFAMARNFIGPASFSLFGVTHTLSSLNATDQIADLILPPFRPWDALICTSQAARTLVTRLQDEMRDYWRTTIGAQQFVHVELPIIPLGVDVPAFSRPDGSAQLARKALRIQDDEVAFLFAGRLSFHAKANPAPAYQALEIAAQSAKVVFIEAGVFPNQHIKDGYLAAQRQLAPSVRFIWVDGKDEVGYTNAWRAADAFISLSDNIQETFGLTPVEAMAAGLPVVVSDWDGYKDTVRDGIDGFRIPTILPPKGVGVDLALRHALELDTYDFYIGRASLATVVEPSVLASRLTRLATDSNLRHEMGKAGAERAAQFYDWPVILGHYSRLAGELCEIRSKAAGSASVPLPPNRMDPFVRFSHFPTEILQGQQRVSAQSNSIQRFKEFSALSVMNYGLHDALLNLDLLEKLIISANKGGLTVDELLLKVGGISPVSVRALMWLRKFGLVEING